MKRPKSWVLGIDPGFGNTGAVLKLDKGERSVEAACWRDDNVDRWEVLRSMSICIPMMETVLHWIQLHDIDMLEVCLEAPIYNGNPKTLMVQMALYTMIQAYIYDYLVPHLEELYLTIVHNKTSKRRMTGDGKADKDAMIAASEWAGRDDLTYNQRHTLADAYAHALSAGERTLALHRMQQYTAEANYEES